MHVKKKGREMMMPGIKVDDKIKEIEKPWSPIEVARVNDHIVRVAMAKGESHWHKHPDEDKLYYVYKGSMIMQMKGQPDIALREGEMAVVPKGVEHCPKSVGPTYVLLFEQYAK